MADKKISQLTSATTPLVGTEVMPIVQSGATVKATVDSLGAAIGYLPAGTGAVATTVQTVLRRVVHVNDFGADPTGTTDSGAAIMAAINSLPTGGAVYGGVVQFGNGTYLSQNTMIEVPNGVWLRGEGPAATLIKAGNSFSQQALVTNKDRAGNQEFMFVSDMMLDGNKAGGAICSNAVLDLVSLFVNSGVFNVVVRYGSKYGIRVHATNAGSGGGGPVLVDNSWVISCNDHNIMLSADAATVNAATGYYLHRVTSEHQASGKSAVYIEGNGRLNLVSIRDLHVEQANTGAGTQGITLDGASDVIVDGAQIQSASSSSGGVLITNQVTNLRFRFQNITNINAITTILTDQKNSVTYGAVNLPFYAAPDVGVFRNGEYTATYSASITPDLALGNHIVIVVTNTSAFTINAPVNSVNGQEMTLEIVNTSGGAMGAITWAFPDLFYNSWTNPASTKRKTIRFRRRSGSWIQIGAISPDM